MPTLILKLNEKHHNKLKGKSETEQEEYLIQHINSFRDMLYRNIDEFQALVLSARPSPTTVNESDYEQQNVAYCELLKIAAGFIEHMQETLKAVLTQYRIFIENLWEAICAGADPTPITMRFQRQTEAFMKQSWDPIFIQADKMMNEIEKSRKTKGDK